jgi:ABC-type branched-subunit amino acid transport system ATPase component
MTTALAIRDLRKSFGGVTALDGCTFDVPARQVTALIGPNGSGKTTVFNCVSGFYRPDEGEVLLGSTRLTGLRPSQIVHLRLARTFQVTRVFRRLTALENMLVPARRSGLRALFWDGVHGHERERAEGLLDFFGLLPLRDEPAGHLSFGQQRLLELAAAMMAEPEVVLLDEPCGGLNPAMIDRLLGSVQQLSERGTTFLVVEHNMGFVMRLAQLVVVMHRGRVIASGEPEHVRSDPAVLDAYLGD